MSSSLLAGGKQPNFEPKTVNKWLEISTDKQRINIITDDLPNGYNVTDNIQVAKKV